MVIYFFAQGWVGLFCRSGSFPRFSLKSKQRPYIKTHVGFKMIFPVKKKSCMILLKLIKSNDIMYVFDKLKKKYHILFTQTPVLCEPYSHNLQLFMRSSNSFIYHIHVYVNINVIIFISIRTNHTSIGTRYLSLFSIQKTGNNQNTLIY